MYARAYMPPLGSSPPPPPRLPKVLGNQAPETKLAEAYSPKLCNQVPGTKLAGAPEGLRFR